MRGAVRPGRTTPVAIRFDQFPSSQPGYQTLKEFVRLTRRKARRIID